MPDLPNDVLSIIAEIHVSRHHYRTCAGLNTACRGVHEDIKAILWKVVIIPRSWDENALKEKCRRLLEAPGSEYTEFILGPKVASTDLGLLDNQLKPRLKAWLSVDRSPYAINANLWNGYRSRSQDLGRFTQVLGIYHRLIRPGKLHQAVIHKLNVWRMSAPEPDLAVENRVSLPSHLLMHSWLRSILVGTRVRSHGHPDLLGELVVDFSRMVGAENPLGSTMSSVSSRSFYDRRITNFDFSILSQSWTKQCAIALAEALRAAFKITPRLFTMCVTIDFTSAPLHAAAESVSPMLDILLPEMLRAFTFTNDSQYVGIKFPGRRVCLTCDDPNSVLVHHETGATSTELYETFELNEDGSLVKVRSSTTSPGADPQKFEF